MNTATGSKHYLSVVVNVRDEDAYLDEFIAYYTLAGVDHFYIYDNESRNPVKDTVAKNWPGLCTVIDFPGGSIKARVLKHFLDTYAAQTEWVLSVDIDEFAYVDTAKHTDLKTFIRRREAAGASGVSLVWTIFGRCGHVARPSGLVMENYVTCNNALMQVKSFAKTADIAAPLNAHGWTLRQGKFYVDARGNFFDHTNQWFHHPTGVQDAVEGQINHYWSRSFDEMCNKMARPRDDNAGLYPLWWIDQVELGDARQDTRLRDAFAQKVRDLLEQKGIAIYQRPPGKDPQLLAEMREAANEWAHSSRHTHKQLYAAHLYQHEPADEGSGGVHIHQDDILIDRVFVLKYLIKRYGYKSYLEIGCCRDDTFKQIDLADKVGVDPASGGTVRDTSDNYFLANYHGPRRKFDLIFIDGLHTSDQCHKDLINALAFLEDGGTIMMHDCLPPSEKCQAVPPVHSNWTGDVWKAAVWAGQHAALQVCLLELDWGVCLVRKASDKVVISPGGLCQRWSPATRFKWQDFKSLRERYLNVRNFDGMLSWLDEQQDGGH